MTHAYDLARANKGAPGVDGMTFDQIEASSLENWLSRLGEELRGSMPTGWRSQARGTYQCQPVRRVLIPKPGGGERPLGIPVPGLVGVDGPPASHARLGVVTNQTRSRP